MHPEIEIIAIGNEILSGATVNSNASYISLRLFQEGFDVKRHTVLPDELHPLKEGLKEALKRSPIVVTTGGLGPTCDDVTRAIAAELFDSSFRFDESLAADLRERYGSHFPTIEDQATVPVKAKILKNPFGTAPGFIFQNEASTLILLPGVPLEMQAMLESEVLPFIKQRKGENQVYREVLHFFHLFESQVDPDLRHLKKEFPKIEFGIYPSNGILTVHLTTHARNEEEAQAILLPPLELLKHKFEKHLFASTTGKIEEAVHALLIAKQLTLSTAESCTGGSIAARLTRYPGASEYFLGGMVTYSSAFKANLLNVSQASLEQYGAVSEEVARQLAAHIKEKTGSDYALAVTGIAGPTGGTPEKPVGTVYCAIAGPGQIKTWKLALHGSREMIIERAGNEALGELYAIVRNA